MRTERTTRHCVDGLRTCPQKWDELQPTDADRVRHCTTCDRDVFFCTTAAETLAHARAGRCIAREIPHASELPQTYVGRPEPALPPRTAEQRRALELVHREQGIEILLNGRLESSSRDCDICGYPVPDFRKSCYVCRNAVGRKL